MNQQLLKIDSSPFFQQMSILQFQLFKSEDFLLFSVLYHCKKYHFKDITLGSAKLWAFLKILSALIINENNHYLQR